MPTSSNHWDCVTQIFLNHSGCVTLISWNHMDCAMLIFLIHFVIETEICAKSFENDCVNVHRPIHPVTWPNVAIRFGCATRTFSTHCETVPNGVNRYVIGIYSTQHQSLNLVCLIDSWNGRWRGIWSNIERHYHWTFSPSVGWQSSEWSIFLGYVHPL